MHTHLAQREDEETRDGVHPDQHTRLDGDDARPVLSRPRDHRQNDDRGHQDGYGAGEGVNGRYCRPDRRSGVGNVVEEEDEPHVEEVAAQQVGDGKLRGPDAQGGEGGGKLRQGRRGGQELRTT